MACYSCGQNRDTFYGGCCSRLTPGTDWCKSCDTGIEAVFVPCCCDQPEPADNGEPCGCRQNPVTPTR